MSHPTFTDIVSSVQLQNVLSSTTHIGAEEISMDRYFNWPILFIFSKIFSSILGIGPINTMNIGFFSLMCTLPVFVSVCYKRDYSFDNVSLYFIAPALYLTLAYHFINEQFVPQFLGLIYLFISQNIYSIFV